MNLFIPNVNFVKLLEFTRFKETVKRTELQRATRVPPHPRHDVAHL